MLAFYGNPLSGKPRSMIPLPAPTSDRVCRTPFCLHTHQRGAQSHTCRQPPVCRTGHRAPHRWLADGIQQRYPLVRKPAQACPTTPVGPSDCPALSLVTVSDTRRGRMVRFLLSLLSIGTMAPRLSQRPAAPWLTARRAHASDACGARGHAERHPDRWRVSSPKY